MLLSIALLYLLHFLYLYRNNQCFLTPKNLQSGQDEDQVP